MRWLGLYLRSRRVPAAIATVLASAAVLGALGRAIDEPSIRLAVAVLAAAIGAAAIGPGLAGADPALERTGAIPWPRRRAGHLIVAAALLTGLLTAAAVTGAALMLRDIAGLVGLVALGAASLGAGRAWLLPAVAVVPAVLLGAIGEGWHEELVTWMVQPTGKTSATVTAATLAAVGTLAYAVRGSRC